MHGWSCFDDFVFGKAFITKNGAFTYYLLGPKQPFALMKLFVNQGRAGSSAHTQGICPFEFGSGGLTWGQGGLQLLRTSSGDSSMEHTYPARRDSACVKLGASCVVMMGLSEEKNPP